MTLGRAITSLLSARPRKLHDAVSRLNSSGGSHHISSVSASLHDSLLFLHNYLNDAVPRNEPLHHQVLLPLIDHSLRNKDSKHGGQAMLILNWLFQDEFLFQAVATALAQVLVTKDDRFVVLGWCTLVRALVEFDTSLTQFPMNGIRERYADLLKIFASCIPQLWLVIRKGSILQDGYELPSRLAVSAADCFLAISEALIKKKVSGNKPNSSASKATKRQVTVVAIDSGDKNTKPASESVEASNMEMEYILWDHLDELVGLVQKLLLWSRKSRPLHAKGLEQVLKWLKEIQGHYCHMKVEARRLSELECCYFLLVGSIMAC